MFNIGNLPSLGLKTDQSNNCMTFFHEKVTSHTSFSTIVELVIILCVDHYEYLA